MVLVEAMQAFVPEPWVEQVNLTVLLPKKSGLSQQKAVD